MPYTEIPVAELKIAESDHLIDVREPDEYTAGHVPGAVNIPLSTIVDAVGAVPVTGTVYVICQLGGRSARACEFLSSQPALSGVTFVNVAGGTAGWSLEGNEVVGGSSLR